ncbi:stage III sporulation protein AG [Natronincola ferrireducens]|uniref:Stage III sporulation protein AG n=1 Tax=Natronincola ferrireducens TaxID=393762 RepID=A0A1G9CII3_9FIRM|nr:stage III sporulation protein AG [Natronincola ferrireducens]SDK51284.1 stage III sporulation protein AG [Natronincola ferrireducens]
MRGKNLNDILKELFSKKYMANILVLLAIALMALIVSSDFLSRDSKTRNTYEDPLGDVLVQQPQQAMTEEEIVEYRLKRILETIRGVGEVEVMITLEMGSEIIPASNSTRSADTTEEKDSNGGTRTMISESTTETIVIANEPSGHKPLVLKEIKPQVNGVIVVAEGAENIEVKAKLYDAVKTVLQVPGHKVQVYSKN